MSNVLTNLNLGSRNFICMAIFIVSRLNNMAIFTVSSNHYSNGQRCCCKLQTCLSLFFLVFFLSLTHSLHLHQDGGED